ncbi:hypothetical protein FA95DRAFT_1278241 [Auriscalpium vulgare]|uniref:Uncharacterized protein n=1 Tax=Auriscalpium vulgare TaxID=40419 RepID=A0ACB8RSB8_9AGAM|nr:hypothetical protein FA95DRAFT_1278241 [Auriscalpium vulgare]
MVESPVIRRSNSLYADVGRRGFPETSSRRALARYCPCPNCPAPRATALSSRPSAKRHAPKGKLRICGRNPRPHYITAHREASHHCPLTVPSSPSCDTHSPSPRHPLQNQTKSTMSRDILRGGYLAAAMSLLEAEAHLMWLEAGLTLTPTGAPYVRSATTQRRTKLVPLDHAYDPRDGYVVPIPRMLSSKHYEAPIWFVRQGGGLGVLAVDVLAPGRRPHIVDGPTLAQLAPPARMSIDVCIEVRVSAVLGVSCGTD